MYFESQYLVKHTKNVDKNLLQAEQLSFPLDAYKPDEMSTTTMATTFKVKFKNSLCKCLVSRAHIDLKYFLFSASYSVGRGDSKCASE
jgi:hypothetical protein